MFWESSVGASRFSITLSRRRRSPCESATCSLSHDLFARLTFRKQRFDSRTEKKNNRRSISPGKRENLQINYQTQDETSDNCRNDLLRYINMTLNTRRRRPWRVRSCFFCFLFLIKIGGAHKKKFSKELRGIFNFKFKVCVKIFNSEKRL